MTGTAIKICGLTDLDDALAAAEAGADYLGFVLVPSSPRCIVRARATGIINALRRYGVGLQCVAVVAGLGAVEAPDLLVGDGFDLVQVHGEVDPATLKAWQRRLILARQVTGPESLAAPEGLRAFAYLLDGRGIERRTAAPATWDWGALRQAGVQGRVFIAGGLTPENVAAAVRAGRPYGVDVASGVETAPGRKDHAGMRRFVQAVRELERE